MDKVRRVFGHARKFLCCQDKKVGIEGSDLLGFQKDEKGKEKVICIQPSADDVTTPTSAKKPEIEPELIKKFVQSNEYLNECFQSDDEEEYFQSDDEETEDSEEEDNTSLYHMDNELLFVLPFQNVDFKYPGKDYDEVFKPRRSPRKVPRIFLNKSRYFGRRNRELDSCSRKFWGGHCSSISRREKDILIDQMQGDIVVDRSCVARDQCIKMFFNNKTDKMQGVNDNSPTPRLNVEINQDNGTSFVFRSLPDTGSTKAILARNVAEKHGIKWDPMSMIIS